MKIWIYSLVSVFLVSSMSLVVLFFLSWSEERLRKILLFLVSFAVGALFGDAVIHLLPESFEKLGINLSTSLWTLGGILVFFVLEKFIHWHHCHNLECDGHIRPPLVVMNLVGDGVHNLIDGILIAASFSVGIPLGVTTSIAVILHEIPQEIGDFGVLVHGGLTVKKAVLYNFFSALFAVFGAVLFLIAGVAVRGFTDVIIPITAGGFIYIAGSDLIPELKHEVQLGKSVLQLASIIAGIAVMALLILLD